MRKFQYRFLMDQSFSRTDAFADVCRGGNHNALIRRRKMPLEDLINSMLCRKGLTLKLELRNYMKITHPGTEISKPGYLKQRMKLDPEAVRFFYQYHLKNFYQDPGITPYLYKDHLVLAADGSDVNIPTTPETVEAFGNASRNGTKIQVQIGLECLYDVLNRFILESDLNPPKFNEMGVAEEQIKGINEVFGTRYPFFVIMDRGYPSIPSFMRMMDAGILFVVRLKSSNFKAEQKAMKSDDEDVEISLTKSRQNHYMGKEDETLVMSRESFPCALSP